jgi:PAS domain S-box-containing protein
MSDDDHLVQTYAQMNRQGIILAAINLVYQESVRCESMEAFGAACLRIIESITASRLSFIGEIRPDGLFREIAISKAAWDLCAMNGQAGHFRTLDALNLQGIFRRIQEGNACCSNSASQEPDWIGVPEGHPNIEAFLGVPFIRAGKTIGVVGVANRVGGYDKEDQEILESVTPTIFESLLRKRAEQSLRESETRLAADLKAMIRLHEVSTNMLEQGDLYSLLQQILDAAIEISGADKGMLQVMDTESGKLRIRAQCGFEPAYLELFSNADENEETPCGQVLRQLSRVFVENISSDPIYGTPFLKTLNAWNVKSLACTPLLSRSGQLVGVLTTHWCSLQHPDDHMLRLIDLLARQAADFVVRIQTEEELGKSQSLLRAVMDGTPDPVYVKDGESRILMCNPALGKTAGLPVEAIIGKTDAEYYGNNAIGQMLHENDLRVMASGKSEVMEETALTPSGYRIFLSAKAPYRNSSGDIIGIVGISHDITERKKMEESLRQTRNELEERVRERTAELSQTVSVLNEEVLKRIDTEQNLRERSEQLRLMASELTMAEQRERQRLAQVLHDGLQQVLVGAKYRLALIDRSKDIKQSTAEVAELLDDAIETSRSLTAELSPPILHHGGLFAALEWLARWMHDKHGLDVDLMAKEPIESPSEELGIFLFQAVRELLFNVIKHAEQKRAHIRVLRVNGRIYVTVADEGTGFDPAQLRAAGGSIGGFGLFSISERLGLLGGEIEIESAPGRGSRITLIAPLSMDVGRLVAHGSGPSRISVAIASHQKIGMESLGRRIRVVLVDDHMVMRQGLAGLLRAEPDMEIVGEASDGSAAVNLVRELRPDVVLMDVTMPGMDGIQATRIIRNEIPKVQVIGLSMFEEGEQAAAMRKAGAIDYITKSGPSDAVISAIRHCVHTD